MERQDFIAEAKKRGIKDSVINGLLGLYDKYAAEGAISYEFLLEGMEGGEDEIGGFYAGNTPEPQAQT
jgi:hypothetical protein